MNPSGQNEVFSVNLVDNVAKYPDHDFSRYTMVATSTENFQKMEQWDSLTKKLNIPYYNLVCCGLFSFSFISLGQEYTYRTIDKKTNSVTKVTKISPLTVESALESKLADRNKEFIGAIQSKCMSMQ